MKNFVLFFVLLGFASCKSDPEGQVVEKKIEVPAEEVLQKANQRFIQKEAQDIAYFMERRKWTMESTGTGLRYMIYEKGKGKAVQEDCMVQVSYAISLLDGTVCYKTEAEEFETVMVGNDNVESGVHEGLQLMRVGDRAKFILPAHLAHGLLGDEDKIPPTSAVVYDIYVRDVACP